MILAALGLLAALLAGRPELAVLAAPFLVALLLGRRTGPDPSVTATAEVTPVRALAGDDLLVRVAVTSPVPVPRLELRLAVPAGLELSDGPAALTVPAPANEPVLLEYRLRTRRWGAYRVGDLSSRAGDDGGFVRWTARLPVGQPVRILPTAATLDALVRPARTRASVGNQVSPARGDGVEFADLRPYRSGDRPRSVNWRASARRGDLWVNDRCLERNADIVFLLDSFADAETGEAAHLEPAVAAACSLAAGYLRARDRVGVVDLAGNSWTLPSASGRSALYRIVDLLVAAHPVITAAERPRRLLRPPILPGRALVVAFTDLADDRFLDTLLDLRRRLVDLAVVVIGSPAGEEAGGRGGERDPAVLAARLGRLLHEHRAELLRRAGAPVVRWDGQEPLGVVMSSLDRAHRRLAGTG